MVVFGRVLYEAGGIRAALGSSSVGLQTYRIRRLGGFRGGVVRPVEQRSAFVGRISRSIELAGGYDLARASFVELRGVFPARRAEIST